MTNSKSNELIMQDNFWSHFPDSLTVLEKCALVENYALTESKEVAPELKKFVQELPSDKPSKIQSSIFCMIALIDDLFLIGQEPIRVKFIKQVNEEVYVEIDGKIKKFPDEVLQHSTILKSFFFNSIDTYNQFRSIVKLKFNKTLSTMSLNESLLTEANRNSIILVDFQPAYSHVGGYDDAIERACEYINQKKPAFITCFFNGEDVGIEDTVQEVAWHYVEHGLDENIVRRVKFREKTYAFLRNWMDYGTQPKTIIKVVRYMVMNDLTDSREIDQEVLEELMGNEFHGDLIDDNIYIPDINVADLHKLSGSLMGGGGKSECLAELQLFMNAFNIKYKLVEEWIYG